MQLRRVLTESLKSIWYEKEQACAICGGADGPVCHVCEQEYFHPELGRCRSCGKLIPQEKEQCGDCQAGKGPEGLQRTVAWGHYTGLWKEFIWNVKFKAQPRRLEEIAGPFSRWVYKRLPPADGVVPVPLHPERLAERGFNQSEIISSLLHWKLGLPMIDVLMREKYTSPQVGLSRRERLQNLKNAFVLKEPQKIQGKVLWLVDDVTTTGATLEACAKVILDAGAEQVYGLCLAAGRETESS